MVQVGQWSSKMLSFPEEPTPPPLQPAPTDMEEGV